jgi:hypothetical protein
MQIRFLYIPKVKYSHYGFLVNNNINKNNSVIQKSFEIQSISAYCWHKMYMSENLSKTWSS